jgi:hypothetical protein
MNEHQCQCERCQFGDTFVESSEARFMQEFGWYAHFVADDEDCPNRINIHTHGIRHTFGHPDFQFCIRLVPQHAMRIFHLLVDKIKEGRQFSPGEIYTDIVEKYPLQFIFAKECGRTVLRAVVTNPQGTYEGKVYEAQFTMLDHIP